MRFTWPRSKKHIDEEKVAKKEQVKHNLRNLLDCGDERGYVALLQQLRPNIRPEELESLVERFRTERRNRLRGV
jgi:hypothetical protein